MEYRPQDFSVTWSAPEFSQKPRTRFWYIMTGIITTLSALDVYLWLDHLTFSTVIILSGTLLIFLADKKPRMIEYTLEWRGITIDGKTYHFNEFQSFWIIEKENMVLLYLMPTRSIATETLIPLENVDINDVHAFLFAHLPEEPAREPLSHIIARYLGF